MRHRNRGGSLILVLAILSLYASSSFSAVVSTGADGAFIPGSSMTLTPGLDGSFNFTHVDIGPGITIDFDITALSGPINVLALDDIIIDGVIDATGSELRISTPGRASFSGHIVASSVTIESGASIVLRGTIEVAGDVSLAPGGATSSTVGTSEGAELTLIAGGVLASGHSGVGGAVLTIGKVALSAGMASIDFGDIAAVIPASGGGTIRLFSTPVPAGLWLMISALSALGIRFGRRNGAIGFI